MDQTPPRIDFSGAPERGMDEELPAAAGGFNAKALAGLTDDADTDALLLMATEWSAHCIATYNGELLSRGLDVAKAIAEFANELEQETP